MKLQKPSNWRNLNRRDLVVGGLAAGVAGTFARPGMSFAQDPFEGRDLLVDKRPVFNQTGPLFGCYDPYGDFTDQKEVATEHLFLPWVDVDLAGLGDADAYALARNRKVLVTIEPWSWALDFNEAPDQLRDRILSGSYDGAMRAILKELSGFRSPVIVRWAQEMENTSGRFTWSLWEPADYIAAYNRMMQIAREMLPGAQLMWSPKGLETLKPYYPDDGLVDLVGLSIFGYEPLDEIEVGKARTFVEATQLAYDLTVGFGKPIWIAELGYEGSLDYLRSWAFDVKFDHPQFPELKEVIYFNDREIWPWPHNLGYPDWRVVRNATNYPARGGRR